LEDSFLTCLGFQVKAALGQETGMTRESLLERIKEDIAAVDPRRRETILEKVSYSRSLCCDLN
jgi:hypothetical protein